MRRGRDPGKYRRSPSNSAEDSVVEGAAPAGADAGAVAVAMLTLLELPRREYRLPSLSASLQSTIVTRATVPKHHGMAGSLVSRGAEASQHAYRSVWLWFEHARTGSWVDSHNTSDRPEEELLKQ